MNDKHNSNDLVTYSRAGDTFHYRWAARRCLHLLDFNTTLEYITIEGSKESKFRGEYVIDTAEYSLDKNNNKSVEYFQLKHSTVRCHESFTLSLLKDTFVGFAKRFEDLEKNDHDFSFIKFTIITNRQISNGFKKSINELAEGKSGGVSFDKTIKLYTKLKGKRLKNFCSLLNLVDGEGNYNAQKHSLHREIANLTIQSEDFSQMLKLVELVRARIEPDNKKQEIDKDDVLEQFGINSEKDLFPAPPLFETLSSVIEREEYQILYDAIIDPISSFTIIGAEAGIGKSITCNQLIKRFTNDSLALAYDCFGNGGYRRISEHRHRASDAFIQIANELAQKELCEPMITINRDQDDRLTREFLKRLSQAITKLRQTNKDALLIILFDAVDNAEMVAKDYSDRCFASFFLKEIIPEGCRVVYFARPERVKLLNPPSKIPQISIAPFNDNESLLHLQTKYPNAKHEDAIEFRRLTDGNPRVQANALNIGKETISELLNYFSAGGITVDDLIEEQLNNAITVIKEQYPIGFEQHVEDICSGLASLPPFVPIEVLAAVSGTDISTVKSFITDLGRPLWITDNYVQFRDEPTESWFISTFVAKPEQVKTYISRLDSLTDTFSYVAEALPSLLLKSGQYHELIELSLSEEKLPTDNPIDARNIQVYRLQFAFKAALKNTQYLDACKIALRAGEEVASSERQMDLLSDNFDLATTFFSTQRLMELAHQRHIRGLWNGSETLYSATFLSSISECEGEARSYLRSSDHWLHRYFEERDKKEKKENSHFNEKLEDKDIIAMFYCHYHLNGYKKAIDFINTWKPVELIYRVVRKFAERLVDEGAFEILYQMSSYGKDYPALVIAINHELMKVGKTSDKVTLTRCLNKIVGPNKWLDTSRDQFDDYHISTGAYFSLLEASVMNKLPSSTIKRALNHYTFEPRVHSINDNWNSTVRSLYFRSISIQACVKNNFDLTIDEVTPKSWVKDKSTNTYKEKEDLNQAKLVFEAFLPWYLVRAKLLSGKRISTSKWHERSQKKCSQVLSNRYVQYDSLPFELTEVRFFNLLLSKGNVDSEITYFSENLINNKSKFRYIDQINALRIANRNPRLISITDALESSCYEIAQVVDEDESPIEHANNYISLSRAVLAANLEDAEVYFEKAVEVISRFGDEAYERWESVNSIAEKASQSCDIDAELAYRFMRCAELIGDTIGREKKWDRDGAMATCVHLSPQSAFAIASRWKDRGVGRSHRMLSSLLDTVVSINAISPSAAWALSTFPFAYDLVDFAKKCIGKETDKGKRQTIFNLLIDDFRNKGIFGDTWNDINTLGNSYDLSHTELDNLNSLVVCKKSKANQHLQDSSNWDPEYSKSNDELYKNIDFSTENGLREAHEIFYAIDGIRDFDGLWKFAGNQITKNNASQYLNLVVNAEFLDSYSIQHAIKFLPTHLKNKPSVQKQWPRIIYTLGKRFPEVFVGCHSQSWVLRDIGADEVTLNAIREGVISGLSESNGLESASTFYGFAGSYAKALKTDEAKELLMFGLDRFELHIKDEYADGLWAPKLKPPSEIINSLSGYIWANLGSPRASERWEAMHAVKRLYELNCRDEIISILELMTSKQADAFIGNKHVFYDMHAKQYLLMALARCSIDDPGLLVGHPKIFSDIALNGEPHLLIQKYATDIAMSIARFKKTLYKREILEELASIGISPFPVLKQNRNDKKRETPWHSKGKIDTSLEYRFGYDFKEHWLKSLSKVFNISTTQVQDLATEVILKDWKLSFSGSYLDDPRNNLWRREQYVETSPHKSSYPKIDGYNFYLGYHAMMVVAAKLLKSMPTVHSNDWDEDVWQEWLESHTLTRDDQFWLSDRRDYVPIDKRVKIKDKNKVNEDWPWQIWPKDFLEVLLKEKDGETWINLAGSWNEYKSYHNESIFINSWLVPSTISLSLQNTIIKNNSKSSTPDFIGLQYFDNQTFEEGSNHFFKLISLYKQESLYGIDEFDPYAASIDYHSFRLNPEIASRFGVTSGKDYRHWYVNTKAVMTNEIWSEGESPSSYEERYSYGNRFQSSLSFLTTICESMNVDLMIEVNIKRELTGHYKRSEDSFGYTPPYRKVYILSKDGRLRDSRKSFKLREKVNN